MIVICTQSWFPEVPGVKLLISDAGIAKVFCRLPGFGVYWRVTGPLGTVLKCVSVEVSVDNFFEFVLGFSVYLNRWRRSLDL